jgi:hypothetical protein
VRVLGVKRIKQTIMIMKAKSKKIRPVSGFGTCGYQVEFSLLDLYRLREMVLKCNTEDENVRELCSVVFALFDKTVGKTSEKFDFLEEDEVEEKVSDM